MMQPDSGQQGAWWAPNRSPAEALLPFAVTAVLCAVESQVRVREVRDSARCLLVGSMASCVGP